MNSDLLDKVLSCPSLPTLPAVAVQVLELMARPNVSVDEIAATIQNDQGLAVRVLKTVNSSFYGVRRPCSTIGQAVVMLGISAVKSIALSFSLVSAVSETGNSEFDYLTYWRRGLYTAVAAKFIARDAMLPTEDEAFLGGLLQDVGVVGMYQALGREYLHVLLKADGDHRALVRHELAELELQHPDVGAMMCQRWRLPLELIMPVRFHERPTAAAPEYAPVVRAVALGNIAHDILTDDDPYEPFNKFLRRARQWFDFDDETCCTLLRRISQGAREVSSLFRLDIGASADIETILTSAKLQREALAGSAPRSESAHGERLGELLTDSQEVDALTGTLTRFSGLAKAAAAFTSAFSGSRSLSIVMLSIDGFEQMASPAEPGTADLVLAETAFHLLEALEPAGGMVCRWESAAFCLILPGFDRAEAARAAAELRNLFQMVSPRWRIAGLRAPVTVSVGSATLEAADPAFAKLEQLMAAAARALQAAAAAGNSVRTFVPRVAA